MSRLQEITRRWERATPGPWYADPVDRGVLVGNPLRGEMDLICMVGQPLESEVTARKGDREFIAHSWADILWLVGRVRELESLVDEIGDEASEIEP